MDMIHPRFRDRLDETRRRRATAREENYRHTRESLVSAFQLLAQLGATNVAAGVVRGLQNECDRLLGKLERLRDAGDEPSDFDELGGELNRFAQMLLVLRTPIEEHVSNRPESPPRHSEP